MPDAKSPSPIISYYVREIARVLPDEEQGKLAAYSEQVATTTHHGDLRRAWHCAHWAVRLAQKPSNSHLGHLVKDVKESYKLWQDTVFGADFGIMLKDGVGPGQDVEIQWVDDALAVATAEAERSGWPAVPWEDLLKEMLSVAPPK
jgi:hypothetical protein